MIGEAINSIIPLQVKIPYKNLTQHTIIIGSTGSGKTYTASRLISRSRGFKRIILDWHGEYHKLVPGAKTIDPYRASINLLAQDIYDTITLLTDLLELTPPQSYILEKIIEKEEPGNIGELRDKIEYWIDESAWMRESRLSLLRKINPLTWRRYRKLFTDNGFKELIDDGGGEAYIIELYRINDPYIRRIYEAGILNQVFRKALERRLKRKILVVVEEAQNIIGRDKPVKILLRMLSEIRKFNVGLVIVSQSPSSLDEEAMKNTNTKIIHSIKSHTDLEVVNRILYLPYEYQKLIPYLDTGEAVVYTRSLKKPIIVKII